MLGALTAEAAWSRPALRGRSPESRAAPRREEEPPVGGREDAAAAATRRRTAAGGGGARRASAVGRLERGRTQGSRRARRSRPRTSGTRRSSARCAWSCAVSSSESSPSRRAEAASRAAACSRWVGQESACERSLSSVIRRSDVGAASVRAGSLSAYDARRWRPNRAFRAEGAVARVRRPPSAKRGRRRRPPPGRAGRGARPVGRPRAARRSPAPGPRRPRRAPARRAAVSARLAREAGSPSSSTSAATRARVRAPAARPGRRRCPSLPRSTAAAAAGRCAGRPDSSTKPLPPRHSSASAACAGPRLQIQYFATAVAMRANAASRGRPRAPVVGAREPERGHRRRLRLDAEVGEHVLHQRLLGERLAEARAVRGVVGRLLDRLPHAGGGAEHAVEPRVDDHLDDRPARRAPPRRRAAPTRRRARSRSTRSSGRRACPSAAGCGSRCACRRAARAAAGSTESPPAPARARETRRTSAPSRTTCARRARTRRRPIGRATVVFARTSEPPWRSVIAMPHERAALLGRRP